MGKKAVIWGLLMALAVGTSLFLANFIQLINDMRDFSKIGFNMGTQQQEDAEKALREHFIPDKYARP